MNAQSAANASTAFGSRVGRWLLGVRIGPLVGGGVWGSVVVVLAFVAISVAQYAQPYVIDEAVFPYVADGILKNGAPYFYNGESRPHDLGLWHPPLYDYLLAGHLLVWGVSSFAVRSFGAICIIASFFVLALALKRIAPGASQYAYVGMGALFMLNPLVISSALVPDIDGTLGVLVVALALWVAAIIATSALSWRLVLGVFAFATLAVSTKFTLAAIVALIVGCAALIAPVQRWWKALWAVAAFVAATIVSLGMLFLLGAILRFDATGPFAYLFGSLGNRPPGRSGLGGTLASLTSGPGSNLIWIGPAIIVAAIVSFVIVLVARPAKTSRSLAGLILGASVFIVLAYSYITASPFSFPKYTAVAVPGFAIVAVLALAVLPSTTPVLRSGRATALRWLATIGYLIVLLVGTGGMFLLDARTQPRELKELVLLTGGAFLGVFVASVILVVLGIPSQGRRWSRSLIAGALASLVIAPIMIQTSTSLVNATAPFATRYYYGERGMAQFLQRADDIIPPGALVIAAKDVGLQLQRPFYEDAGLLPLPPSELRSRLEALDAPYLVTRNVHDYSEMVYPEQFEVLREFYVPVLAERDSDFRLWQHK